MKNVQDLPIHSLFLYRKSTYRVMIFHDNYVYCTNVNTGKGEFIPNHTQVEIYSIQLKLQFDGI